MTLVVCGTSVVLLSMYYDRHEWRKAHANRRRAQNGGGNFTGPTSGPHHGPSTGGGGFHKA